MGEGFEISFTRAVHLQNDGILAAGHVNRVVFSGYFMLTY